ncbi:trypco2 family protein [Streptomyces griseiscabiei]|uniref:Trypsin-co-occurring domain-containing protein n=1 Tax=Streptomyces griseiscabiei TaxID=2993540 RepID=A0ABU4L9P4_9ACTN|nr:trypco2 family protein [Streptomyces griseiscabiei]MBZ3903725.1 hypothetical protein [Streptomyces griseiscabiei]MDX2912470.1 hypothetical protein [Streptomyces griseiscabiei]
MADRRMELGEAIEGVREELTALRRRRADHEVVFDVGPVEVEFVVEAAWDAGVQGKAKFWVLETGADLRRTGGTAHTVRVVLTPRDGRDGQPLQVSDRGRGLVDRPGADGS